MMRSELLSWPVTLAILAIAFGSLVAAGLPLMLTMAGLLVAAGALVLADKVAPGVDLGAQLRLDVRPGAGHRLRPVPGRPLPSGHAPPGRGARRPSDGRATRWPRQWPPPARPSPSPPSRCSPPWPPSCSSPRPAFRSMALGIMLSVVAVLAATLTLLPAVLGKLGTRIDSGRIRLPDRRPAPAGTPTVTASSSASTPGVAPCGGTRLPGRGRRALAVLGLAAAPVIGLRTSMPSITIIPASANARVGYDQVTDAFGPGAPGTLQVVVGPPPTSTPRSPPWLTPPGSPGSSPGRPAPATPSTRWCPPPGHPTTATGATIDRIRHALPAGQPGRRRRGGEPRPTTRADLQDPAGVRRPWPPWASCCCSSPWARR